ncbi:MAG: hypothetical protein QGH14_04895, partial [Candidatus Bathyarchaeota archaeon]|nr:hypothetical protein [Candidatus Bathyarchaeota archaeon]
MKAIHGRLILSWARPKRLRKLFSTNDINPTKTRISELFSIKGITPTNMRVHELFYFICHGFIGMN